MRFVWFADKLLKKTREPIAREVHAVSPARLFGNDERAHERTATADSARKSAAA